MIRLLQLIYTRKILFVKLLDNPSLDKCQAINNTSRAKNAIEMRAPFESRESTRLKWWRHLWCKSSTAILFKAMTVEYSALQSVSLHFNAEHIYSFLFLPEFILFPYLVLSEVKAWSRVAVSWIKHQMINSWTPSSLLWFSLWFRHYPVALKPHLHSLFVMSFNEDISTDTSTSLCWIMM